MQSLAPCAKRREVSNVLHLQHTLKHTKPRAATACHSRHTCPHLNSASADVAGILRHQRVQMNAALAAVRQPEKGRT
jgi:hypothetical protein